jgi:hypothetical protein
MRPPELYLIYEAGNFIQCKPESPFFPIGETKYGRPILDRELRPSTPLAEALKYGFLSFDAAMASNLGVARPIDIMVMPADRGRPTLTAASSAATPISTRCPSNGARRCARRASRFRTRPSWPSAEAEMADIEAAFQRLRAHGLALPEAVEERPWGHSALKVRGKTFVFLNLDAHRLSLSTKLPVSRHFALMLDFTEPTGYGLGRAGWITSAFSPARRSISSWSRRG